MGRPKGSKNKARKKRKYTKRNTIGGNHLTRISGEKAAEIMAGGALLVSDIKQLLMDAKPEVAAMAIEQLVPELQWLERMIGHPAP